MSFRLRLFLVLATLAALSVAATALLSRGGARRVLTQLVRDDTPSGAKPDGAALDTLATRLMTGWTPEAGFMDVHPLLSEFTRIYRRDVALFDGDAHLVAAVGLPATGVNASLRDSGVAVRWSEADGVEHVLFGGRQLRTGTGELAGVLLPFPDQAAREAAERRRGALGGLDRRVLLAAMVALALALAFSALFARGLAAPIRNLAQAVDDLGRGDLARRVTPRGKDDVGALQVSFNRMAASLEKSEGLRRRLIADVAHELRTPLTALRGQVEAMQDGLVPTAPDGLASIHDDVQHLSRLVAELQDLALAEGGQLRLDLEPVDLTEELRAALRTMGLGPDTEPRAMLEGDPLTVTADRRRLRQVFHNLLANARTHAPHGSITVTVATHDGGAQVTVADDGPGIAPEDLPYIFDRFYRADTRDPEEGAGLGLAISKELVALHGGNLTAESTVGRGCRFTVSLGAGSWEPGAGGE